MSCNAGVAPSAGGQFEDAAHDCCLGFIDAALDVGNRPPFASSTSTLRCVAGAWASSSEPTIDARVGFYGCLAYQKRGATVCANNPVIRMESIDKAVLATIGGDVLKPKIIDAVIAGVKDAMQPANITRETAQRRREIASLEQEIGGRPKLLPHRRRSKRVNVGATN